ncbi:hypothetical protein DNI29_11525 [Hymenobacter sediminis]|uniref:DUF6712 family protein n=1 Tax=Hymenobacter sediminis TaxID=2218621 RepID=UPI000DA6C419|nr:hypothetical protein [Hymenobacter sediminis]RPD46788.1 hypothetical protein DNI29_11525 [Hymenobacter sediminis]
METLLFSREDFAPYVQLPELDEGRLEPHMLEAQRRLRPLLGEQLYMEVARLHKASELSGDYLELYSKSLPALVYAAAAQFWPFSQTTVTRYGLREKESQHSKSVDPRTLAAQAAIYDGRALSYEVELRTWLISKAASFTGFYPDQSHCGSHAAPARTATVVVQAIGRPAYRPR